MGPLLNFIDIIEGKAEVFGLIFMTSVNIIMLMVMVKCILN